MSWTIQFLIGLFLLNHLVGGQLAVGIRIGHQLLVGARGGDASVLHHQYPVGNLHRSQAVGYNDRRLVHQYATQSLLNQPFRR